MSDSIKKVTEKYQIEASSPIIFMTGPTDMVHTEVYEIRDLILSISKRKAKTMVEMEDGMLVVLSKRVKSKEEFLKIWLDNDDPEEIEMYSDALIEITQL